MRFRVYKEEEGIKGLVLLAKEYKRECNLKEDLLTLLDRIHHKIKNHGFIVIESEDRGIIGFIMSKDCQCYILPEFRCGGG